MATDSGLGAAVASALAVAGEIVADEAAPMLPLLDAGQLAEAGGVAGGIARAADQARRGPGRPRGAMNKRTAKVRDYLLSRYVHPAEALAQAYSRPVDVLAVELGCSKLEAFQAQMRAAAELLPYIESKMPVAVSGDIRGQVVMTIGGLTGAEGAHVIDAEAGITGLLAMALTDEENQGVAEA